MLAGLRLLHRPLAARACSAAAAPDTSMYAKGYGQLLTAALKEHGGLEAAQAAPAVERVLAAAPDVMQANLQLHEEAPTSFIAASYVLAAARELEGALEPAALTTVLAEAQLSGDMINRFVGRAVMAFKRDKLARVEQMAAHLAKDRGPAFAVEHERRGDEEVAVRISRCFFQRFFEANGRPELTGVFCAVDRAYFDIHSSVEVQAETMAEDGVGACSLRVVRTSS